MINLHPLYSSSSGNSFHLESKKTNILIDAGVSYKRIVDSLNEFGKNMHDISAVIITHEHVDHIKGLPLLCRKNDIPIYACGKTAEYIEEDLKEKNIKCNIFKTSYGQPFKIKDIEITPFEISHDAVMPCGYRIKSGNMTLSYATDLGYVSDEVYENLNYSDFVVLEANYDTSMLEFGKYPYPLKRRIKGATGHLSNDESANAISKLAKSGQTNFLLAHLSENNNDKSILLNTMDDILRQNDLDSNSINLNIANKIFSNEEFCIC